MMKHLACGMALTLFLQLIQSKIDMFIISDRLYLSALIFCTVLVIGISVKNHIDTSLQINGLAKTGPTRLAPTCLYSQYHAVLKNDGIISLINSKVLPYTLQEFCHIIFTKMCSNLSCIVQNTVVINTQQCIDILMSASTGMICCVNVAAFCIIVLSYVSLP